jgi:hypothetical protein
MRLDIVRNTEMNTKIATDTVRTRGNADMIINGNGLELNTCKSTRYALIA